MGIAVIAGLSLWSSSADGASVNAFNFVWIDAVVPLGDVVNYRPGGLAPDGRAIAGNMDGEAVLWRAEAGSEFGSVQVLGHFPVDAESRISSATAVSSNGWVIGYTNYTAFNPTSVGNIAWRWNETAGFQALDRLPGCSWYQSPFGVSSSGEIIVGFGVNAGCTSEASVWNIPLSSEAFIPATGLPVSHLQSAVDVSADGSVIVGSSSGGNNPGWILASGSVALLADVGGGALPTSKPFSVSGDGQVVVGRSLDSGGFQTATRWVGGNPQNLGALVGSAYATAFAANFNGSRIVGESAPSAFIWTEESGIQTVQQFAAEQSSGSDLESLFGKVSLRQAIDISDDGSIIMGTGVRSGTSGCWLFYAPVVACPIDLTTTSTNPGTFGYGVADGVSDGADLAYFIEAWLGSSLEADFSTTNTNPGSIGFGIPDGVLNGADLSFYIEAWLAGCP